MRRRDALKALGPAGALWALGRTPTGARQDRPGGPAVEPPEPRVRTIDVFKEGVEADALGPDGRLYYANRKVLDLDTDRVVHEFSRGGFVVGLGPSAFSPDGRRLATVNLVLLTVPGTQKAHGRRRHEQTLEVIKVYDTTGREVRAFHIVEGSTIELAFNADATQLALFDRDERLTLLALDDGFQIGCLRREPRHRISGGGSTVINADARRAASTGQDHPGETDDHVEPKDLRYDLKLWDLRSDRFRAIDRQSVGAFSPNSAVALSRDGTRVVVVGDDKLVMLDFDTGQVIRTFELRMIRSPGLIVFEPGDRRLLAGSQSGEVWVWDVATGRLLATLAGPQGVVRSMAFTPAGLRVISGGSNWWTELDPATGKQLRRVEPLRVWDSKLP